MSNEPAVTTESAEDVTSFTSAADVLEQLLARLRVDQGGKPARERAVLITDLEKAQVWAEHHDL